ncbi:MAG: DUF448 domain-containing protein [Candidatus Methylomirabilales bacterium]
MKGRTAPERTCIGCGRKRGQVELIRFSRGPAGLQVHLERGMGRGAYMCPDAGCLELAVKRKALQRTLGAELGPVSVHGLREAIHQAILQKVQRLLGLARRARRVVAGTRAVERALEAGRVRLLLLSQDPLPAGGSHIRGAGERRGVPVATLFSREDMERVVGAPSRKVVGLLEGGFADGILETLRYWIP